MLHTQLLLRTRACSPRQGLQRDASSTGNGLRIALKCALLMEGELELRFLTSSVVASLTVPFARVDTAAPELPAGLRVASLDDDHFVRKIDRRLFDKLGFEAHVRGATLDEILDFPAFVVGLHPPPQVVLLDENLNHPAHGGKLIKGTELVPKLRDLGFDGKIVIKSANQSSTDLIHYEQSGVDGAIDKVLSSDAFVRELAYILAGEASWRSESVDVNVLGSLEVEDARERVQFFTEQAASLAEAISAHFAAGDRKLACQAAHQLKALAGYIGATPLVNSCEALRNLEGQEAWMSELATLANATRTALAGVLTVAAPSTQAPLVDSRQSQPSKICSDLLEHLHGSAAELRMALTMVKPSGYCSSAGGLRPDEWSQQAVAFDVAELDKMRTLLQAMLADFPAPPPVAEPSLAAESYPVKAATAEPIRSPPLVAGKSIMQQNPILQQNPIMLSPELGTDMMRSSLISSQVEHRVHHNLPVLHAAQRAATQKVTPPTPLEQPVIGLRILIVDDCQISHRVLRRTLHRKLPEAEITGVKTVDECLELTLSSSDKQPAFGVVFLDQDLCDEEGRVGSVLPPLELSCPSRDQTPMVWIVPTFAADISRTIREHEQRHPGQYPAMLLIGYTGSEGPGYNEFALRAGQDAVFGKPLPDRWSQSLFELMRRPGADQG